MKKMKYQYRKAPKPSEYSVFTGKGEKPLDKKVILKDVPCMAACPVKTNIPGYIEEIYNGNHDVAYRINQEDNVFPSVLGRICTRPCEGSCRHKWTNINGSVDICHLKRAAADHRKTTSPPLPHYFDSTKKKVAIIGGGPSGLTAARELIRYGHEVTLYEKEKHLGGMMVDGIPKFRLPREHVETEVNNILQTGIKTKLEAKISQKQVGKFLEDYDAVLLTTGTTKARDITLEGMTEGVAIPGLDFMKQYNNAELTSMKGKVIVIGGGFTAVDCARSCARAAKKLVREEGSVTIVYRRSDHYMSADYEELEDIRKENIHIRTLVSPVSVKVDKGKIKSVTFIRNRLKKNKAGDKPEFEPILESEFTMDCDHLIVAIGQQQDYSLIPNGVKLGVDFTTNIPHLFLAGDYRTGSKDVIHAISEGKDVADKIDTFLMKVERTKTHVAIELLNNDGKTGRVRDHDLLKPEKMPIRSVKERINNNSEVEKGLPWEASQSNASRCYLCHYKFEIDQDKCIHCDWCIQAAPRECIKRVSRLLQDEDGYVTGYIEATLAKDATYIWIDSNECIRCGKCLRVCPTEAISMRKSTLKKNI